MFHIRESIFLVLLQTVLLYGWPLTNYSKSSATYGIGALDDEVDWSQHPCKRECKDGAAPMTCRYGFTVENYATMSKACYDCPFNLSDCHRPHCMPADGNQRMAIVVNRRLPGQSNEVCKRDRIIVDVKNMLNGESTTIHWHGQHQRGTPFMDGVPMVTQCPILAGDSFRYEFTVENAGTHWWHAHSGVQRSDGLFGAVIVRNPPSQNLISHMYDRDEHVMVLNEWSERSLADVYSLLYQTGVKLINVHSILVNGLGPYNGNEKSAHIPRSVFRVRKGERYRFRVINAGSHDCALSVSVDQHPLTIVSSDGSDVEPIEVDVFRMVPGERYDFVLNADREVNNYWIRVSGNNNCKSKPQQAILRYEGADDTVPDGLTNFEPGRRLLNPGHQGSETDGAMCVSCSLTSVEPDDRSLAPIPDHQIYLNLDVYTLDNPSFHRKDLYDTHQVPVLSPSLQINHLSFKAPDFPLQTQSELVRADQLCNVTEAKCTREQCSCPYVMQFKLNSTVEIVFVSEATHKNLDLFNFDMSHGMHLHGFYFRVLAIEKVGRMTSVEEIKNLDRAGKIHRKLKGAPWKDVLDVPSGGYAVVRFRADNPGYWFFHCHYETHSHNGMAMVLKIGEHKDFPPVPKDFPKCHYRSGLVLTPCVSEASWTMPKKWHILGNLIVQSLNYLIVTH